MNKHLRALGFSTNLISKLFASFLFLVIALIGRGQVTVAGAHASSNGTYSTLAQAFTGINGQSQTGNTITVSITADIADNNAATLNAGTWTTLTISPSGGATRTLSGTLAGNLFDLNGADNVTIDGLNSGSNALVLNNTNTGGTTLIFRADATNNTVTNCTIRGANTSTTSGIIVFSTAASGGNDGNIIHNNVIRPSSTIVTNAIYALGTASPNDNSNIQITNNSIQDFFIDASTATGILVGANNTGWTISGNSFFQTASRSGATTSTMTCINLSSTTGNGFTISGNFIGGQAVSCGVSGTPLDISGAGATRNFNGIIANVGTTSVTNIDNNTIRNISFVTQSTGTFSCISITAGNVNVGTTTGNTIGNVNNTGSANNGINFQNSSSTGGIFNGIINSGTGTVVIGPSSGTGNIIAGVTLFGASNTLVSNFYGIRNTAAAASLTIRNNQIGSLNNVSNIVSVQASGGGTGTSLIYGISQESTGAVPVTITGNTIANISYTTSAGSTGVRIWGINNAASTSTVNISNNIILSLTNNSPNTGTGTTASVIGILNSASTGSNAITISGNSIRNLRNSNSGTGSYSVIGVRTSGSSSATFSKNSIFSISLGGGNTSSQQYGLQITAGTWTISNNMMRLGIDSSGTGISGAYDIQGINASLGTNNIYHNSIFIGGSGSGTSPLTYAIQSGTSNNVKNNIIANRRTNSNAGVNIGLLFSGTSGTAQDANVYYVDASNGGALARSGSTNYTTVVALQAIASGRDVNSVISNPQFLNATGATSLVNLKINTAVATEVESGGVIGLGISDDIDGDLRCPTGGCPGGVSKPDIGADEGSFTSLDLSAPILGTASIANQTNNTAPTTTVTISDNNSVNTAGGTNPRLYYKKCSDANVYNDNTNATSGWKYVEATNSVSPFSFTLDYSLLQGTINNGAIINYFVVAQDNASTPNVGISNSLTFASTPTSVSLGTANMPTGTLPSYVITLSSGTYTVGTGGDFSNLTGTCGCFRVINASTLTADITLNISSDIVEDNTNQLSSTNTARTINIRPNAASLRTISGTVGGSSPAFTTTANMIGITGNSTVNIDGNFSGSGQYLLFRSTNSTPANTYPCIKVNASTAGTSSLTINNCIFEGNSTDNSLGLITVNASGNTVSVSAVGNDFRDARSGTTGRNQNGVYVNQSGAAVTLNNNNFYNFGLSGSYIYLGGTVNITGNKYYQENSFSDAASYPVRISENGGTTYTISNNIIGGNAADASGTWLNSSSTNTFYGIWVHNVAATNKGTISGNLIKNIYQSGTGNTVFSGIQINSGAYDLTNNIIGDSTVSTSLRTDGAGTSATSAGIFVSSSSTTAFDITGNTVANITCKSTNTSTSTAAFNGIYVSHGSAAIGIQGNRIRNNTLNQTTPAQSSMYGMYLPTSTLSVGTISGNIIDGLTSNAASTSETRTVGILINASTAATISNNFIRNLTASGANTGVTVKGIWNGAASASHSITNNTINALTTASTNTSFGSTPFAAVNGILTGSIGGNQSISNNTIYDLNATATVATNVMAIQYGTTANTTGTNSRINANKIYDLRSSSTTNTSRIVGIQMWYGGSNATNVVTVSNNLITISNGSATNDVRIFGIRDAVGTGNVNYYYNNVHISGANGGGGTSNSYAFLRDAQATTITLRNNILQNIRSGGSGSHYAIGNTNSVPATGWSSTASNYNNFYTTTAASTGEWGSGTARTLAQFQTSSSGDANSINRFVAFTNTAIGDLSLNANANCGLNNSGVVVSGTTTDYGGTSRSGSTPDIGAYEFSYTAPNHTATVNGISSGTSTICQGSNINLVSSLGSGTATPVTYSWTGPNSYTNSTQSPTITSVLASAGNTYQVNITDATGCLVSNVSTLNNNVTVAINAQGSWLGSTNTNYNESTNWCGGVPANGDNITILNSAPNMPILDASRTVGNLIWGGSSTTLSINGQTLTINGTITGAGTFVGSNTSSLNIQGAAGTINFDQTTDANRGTLLGTNALNNLTIGTSGDVVIGNKVNLFGALDFGSGNGTLSAGDGLLVFRNTSSSTSRLAAVTGTPTITGAVVVENYINNQNRGWRLLTSPLTSAGSGGTVTPSVQSNWQSVMGYGGNYGTNFYSPSGLNGMDGTSNRNSLLRFNGDTLTVGGWTNINSTGVNQFNADAQSGTSSTNPVFFAFIRGDKTVTAVPNAGTPNAFVATTLAAKGRITYGSKTISLLGKTNGYTAIGNPFISPVDLSVAAATATGLTGTYYYYNPSNAAWVAVSSSNGWTSGSFTQNMQTGTAVLAQFNGGNSGSIQFTEASKVSNFSAVQTGAGNGLQDNMRINLFDVNSTSGAKTQLDELFVGFKTGYNAGFINTEDGEKMLNAGENLSSRVGNKLVAIDVRPYIQNSDSIFMNFTNTRVANYEFEFDPSNFDASVTSAKLVDKFLNSETPISLSAKTTVPFSVTATAGSNAADRFMVVFNGTGALPNRGFSVTGEKLGTNKVKINWEAVNEFGVKHYELEHSKDGRTFSKINTQVGKNGNATNSYTYTDNNPTNGVNYYRIKTTQNNDIERYSTTITINLSFNTQQSSLLVYPNPVKGNVIGLQLQDLEKGVYSVRILSIEGKEVYKQQLQVNGSSLSTTINPSTRLAQGTYTLQLVGKNGSYTQKVVVE
jgi:trimeric autotransporter adhesin